MTEERLGTVTLALDGDDPGVSFLCIVVGHLDISLHTLKMTTMGGIIAPVGSRW